MRKPSSRPGFLAPAAFPKARARPKAPDETPPGWRLDIDASCACCPCYRSSWWTASPSSKAITSSASRTSPSMSPISRAISRAIRHAGVLQLEAMPSVAGIVMLKNAQDAGKIATSCPPKTQWRKPVQPVVSCSSLTSNSPKCAARSAKPKASAKSREVVSEAAYLHAHGFLAAPGSHLGRARPVCLAASNMIHPDTIIHPAPHRPTVNLPLLHRGEHVELAPAAASFLTRH